MISVSSIKQPILTIPMKRKILIRNRMEALMRSEKTRETSIKVLVSVPRTKVLMITILTKASKLLETLTKKDAFKDSKIAIKMKTGMRMAPNQKVNQPVSSNVVVHSETLVAMIVTDQMAIAG